MPSHRRSLPLLALLVLGAAGASLGAPAGFLRAQGRFLGTDTGEVQLRGLGIGGWMVQEGYMLGTADFAGTQREIRSRLESVVGKARTEAFYQAWRDNFLTRRDVDSLAAWGFNAIRLPMHWDLYMEAGLPVRWKDEGFRRTDSLLAWCKANRIWLILDLHAAPGGQGNDLNISDGDSTLPSLWESAENRTLSVELWRRLAERYRNEPWVGAYDLLNEPNWPFDGANRNGCDDTKNAPLRELYLEMTKAIRSVDPDHLIIAEGNCWGGNYAGLMPPWDGNMALSFHKYWNSPTVGTVNPYFALRDTYNVPIWLGESGENGNEWFRQTIKMLESERIGWSWWPYKKIESVVGPVSVSTTPGWDAFVAWGKGGARPDSATLDRGLMDLAGNLRIDRSRVGRDVLDAMFRQVRTDSVKPWKDIRVPGSFAAAEYDLGGDGMAYHDARSMNVGVKGEGSWNEGWSFRNDGVDIQWSNEERGWNLGWVEVGDWLQYTVQADSTTRWVLQARTAGPGGTFAIEVDGQPAAQLAARTTAGWGTWTTSTSESFPMAAGTRRIRLKATATGSNLGQLTLVPAHWACVQDGSCQTVGASPRTSPAVGASVAWTREGIRSTSPRPIDLLVRDARGATLLRTTLAPGGLVTADRLPAKGLHLVTLDGKELRFLRP